jgi:hypothetical protein
LRRTRLSLFYDAGYLLTGGAGLLFAPRLTLALFLSSGAYDDVMVRFAGALLIALGILVLQVVRLRVEKLYPTTVAVRLLILACLAGFYLRTYDPLMLVLFAIVSLGVAGTLAGLLLDREERDRASGRS